MCKAFPLTLKGIARQWFTTLPKNSINRWRELQDKFILAFTSCKEQYKTQFYLKILKQKKDEPLRESIARYNRESLCVKGVHPILGLHCLVENLLPGPFAQDLAKFPQIDMENLKNRSEGWIRVEEA
jgi:hypothetical protein